MASNEKTSLEWYEICMLMLLGLLFGIVETLFIGAFIWHHFGYIIFIAVSSISIPVTTIFKYFGYKKFYLEKDEMFSFFSEFICWDKIYNYISAPANTLKVLALIASILSAFALYNIYYGALFIQILKLFVTEMGMNSFTANYLAMSLVFCSIIPDAISYIKDQYDRVISMFDVSSASLLELEKPGQKIFIILFLIFISYIFAQIEFTQLINSYQHYLIEVLGDIIPFVANQMFLFLLFLMCSYSQLYGMAKQFVLGVNHYADNQLNEELTAKNIFQAMLLVFIAGVRSIFLALMVGELAVNPYNINAKYLALFFSVIRDTSAYFGICSTVKDEHMRGETRFIKYTLYISTVLFASLIVLNVINIPLEYALLSLALGYIISEYYPPFIFDQLKPAMTSENLLKKGGPDEQKSRAYLAINNGVRNEVSNLQAPGI